MQNTSWAARPHVPRRRTRAEVLGVGLYCLFFTNSKSIQKIVNGPRVLYFSIFFYFCKKRAKTHTPVYPILHVRVKPLSKQPLELVEIHSISFDGGPLASVKGIRHLSLSGLERGTERLNEKAAPQQTLVLAPCGFTNCCDYLIIVL